EPRRVEVRRVPRKQRQDETEADEIDDDDEEEDEERGLPGPLRVRCRFTHRSDPVCVERRLVLRRDSDRSASLRDARGFESRWATPRGERRLVPPTGFEPVLPP